MAVGEVESDKTRVWRSRIRMLLGWTAGRAWWGIEPIDLRGGYQGNQLLPSGRVDAPTLRTRAAGSAAPTGGFDSHDHHGHHHAPAFYQVPLRRHVWSEQCDLHASWGELFLDLIFVGAAYRLGSVVKYSFCEMDDARLRLWKRIRLWGQLWLGVRVGLDERLWWRKRSGSSGYNGRMLGPAASSGPSGANCPGPTMGVLWALGLFLCCLRIWYNDLHYRSRFESASRVHRFLDVTGYFLLVYAAANIEPVHEYMREGSPQLGIFLIVLTCAQGLWLMRWLEIAVFSRDEESRRFSALRLVDDGPVLIWWLLAWLNFNRSLDGVHAYGVPVCLIIGAYWTDIRLNVRVHRMAILRGCDPDGEVRHIPKERTRVPMNVEFAIHRLNEFMMLMVGEGVLQLVINKTTEWTNHQGGTSLVSGFVLSLALLYLECHRAASSDGPRVHAPATGRILSPYRAAERVCGVICVLASRLCSRTRRYAQTQPHHQHTPLFALPHSLPSPLPYSYLHTGAPLRLPRDLPEAPSLHLHMRRLCLTADTPTVTHRLPQILFATASIRQHTVNTHPHTTHHDFRRHDRSILCKRPQPVAV